MAYENKRPPVKLTLEKSFYNLLVDVLDKNKEVETGSIDIVASRLKDKLMKYPRTNSSDDGADLADIGFFSREASDTIYQLLVFIAMNTDIEVYNDYYSELAEVRKAIQNKKEE